MFVPRCVLLWTACLLTADPVLSPEHPPEVRAKPGETVPLQCQGPRNASITAIKWSRPDLKPEDVVFFFRENRSYEGYQHSSFHGRVELRDPEMKDGDASVVLKNVAVNDTGTYECLVSADSDGLTKHVRLTVTDSGHTAGNIWLKVVAGLTVSGLVLFIIGVCCYPKYKT